MMRDIMWSLWQGWKAIASRIGHWQSRLILSLIYFVVLPPVALGIRLLADPLGLKGKSGGKGWQSREYPTLTLEQARRQ